MDSCYKLFLVVQFIALRELAFWAGYSFLYIGNWLIELLIHGANGSGEDEEIRHYFEGMYQSVEQIDSRVHTGNAVSDAVVGSKFRYAAKQLKDIKLDAGGFPISTKEDKEVHGIGLRNIKKCAAKYGGDMDCMVKDNTFILSVMVKGRTDRKEKD